jgi:hypothetical protein
MQEVEKDGGGTEWKEVTLENYNILIPASLYLQGLTSDYFVVVEAHKGTELYWRQPLIIIQNRYESPMLNEWDGSFKISEKDGTIMSTMIGAGYKDSENKFNGVLMGDLAITELKPGTSEIASVNRMVGLYGFNEGS